MVRELTAARAAPRKYDASTSRHRESGIQVVLPSYSADRCPQQSLRKHGSYGVLNSSTNVFQKDMAGLAGHILATNVQEDVQIGSLLLMKSSISS